MAPPHVVLPIKKPKLYVDQACLPIGLCDVINMTQPRITRVGTLREGMSRLGWTVVLSVKVMF